MKMSDIINQLRGVLPKYSDLFSTAISVSNISVSSGIATITTNTSHNLTTGDNVVLRNVSFKNPIDSVSQDGLVFTFTTVNDHDLTFGWPEHETVTLSNFTDSVWSNSFQLTGVPNRKTFKVRSTNNLPVLNGEEKLVELRSDGVNGRYSVTVTGSTSFTIAGDFIDGSYIGGSVSSAQRISGAATEDRALDQYTAQNTNSLWMFVVMKDATVGRDRTSQSDSISTKTTGTDMRLRLIDGFSILIFKNTSDDIAAIEAIDLCRHDLLLPILRTVNGVRFDTGLAFDGDFRCILTGHNHFDYNRAVIIYRYEFEVSMDLTNEDSVVPEDTRAFRDIDYTSVVNGDDTTDMTILPIDLDDEPL